MYVQFSRGKRQSNCHSRQDRCHFCREPRERRPKLENFLKSGIRGDIRKISIYSMFGQGRRETVMSDDKPTYENRSEKTPSMNSMDVIAIIACWAGVAAVTYFTKDPVVAMIAIAAAFYLAKWVILKKEK